jgi:hypothetical protein
MPILYQFLAKIKINKRDPKCLILFLPKTRHKLLCLVSLKQNYFCEFFIFGQTLASLFLALNDV